MMNVVAYLVELDGVVALVGEAQAKGGMELIPDIVANRGAEEVICVVG